MGYESVSSNKNDTYIYIYTREITSLTILAWTVYRFVLVGGSNARRGRESYRETSDRYNPIQGTGSSLRSFQPVVFPFACARNANHPDHRGPARYMGHVTSNDRIHRFILNDYNLTRLAMNRD